MSQASRKILLPFAMQQQQALRDAFITDPNGSVFGVGLATHLQGGDPRQLHKRDPSGGCQQGQACPESSGS
jgi:hypothetical protein